MRVQVKDIAGRRRERRTSRSGRGSREGGGGGKEGKRDRQRCGAKGRARLGDGQSCDEGSLASDFGRNELRYEGSPERRCWGGPGVVWATEQGGSERGARREGGRRKKLMSAAGHKPASVCAMWCDLNSRAGSCTPPQHAASTDRRACLRWRVREGLPFAVPRL